ncbi:hypothetical protein V8E53_014844 [Lactarius tabidus]
MALFGTVIALCFSHVVIRRVSLLLCVVAGLLCLWSKSQFQLTRRISYCSELRVRSVRVHAPYAEAVDLIFLMVLPYVPV